MTAYVYERETQIVKEAIQAASRSTTRQRVSGTQGPRRPLPGECLGSTLRPDAAGFHYKAQGYEPVIAVTLLSGVIRAASLGVEAKDGGFWFYEGATEEGARKLAAKIIARVKTH
jgi:hypothetical protein